ncbi:MAG TPA: hypothetical protein VHE35_12370 [Kofleriaceae bacterium]|nr:hypothetical protein [Kofleriaceae bacterium]
MTARAPIALAVCALAAGAAHAQPSATAPTGALPPAATLLVQASAAADAGDWTTVIDRATPVAADPRQRDADRAEAHKLLGLAAFAQGRLDDADRELFAYLRLDLDGHLDPHLYPPETVAYFESVRTRHAAELHALRPRPARTALVNLLPPFGQFQNHERTKGWILAGLGGAALAANVTTYVIVSRWCDERDGTCEVDGRSRRPTAEKLLSINRVAGVAAIALYAYGVIDGFRHYRRRPAVVVAPFAAGVGAGAGTGAGAGAVLGLSGRF